MIMVVSKSCRITNSFEISFSIAHFIQRTPADEAARLAAGNSGPRLRDVRAYASDMQLASDSQIGPATGIRHDEPSRVTTFFRLPACREACGRCSALGLQLMPLLAQIR